MRDIDLIVEKVKEQLPEIKVSQLQKSHPADDDGIWWFSLPGVEKDIQIESSFGNCPFIIETNELCCENARQSNSIDEIVVMVVEYLLPLREDANLAGRA